MNLIRLLPALFLLAVPAMASVAHPSEADSLFAHYFAHAQALSDAYPQEKVHLHFDNTSYYVGDTIWFKAYVVTAEDNRPSSISTPLYVELMSQTGYTTHRQIVKIENGEGHGQIPLTKYALSGFYEVRAYTKWMLALDPPHYFSRVFPVYRWLDKAEEEERGIADYHWDASFRRRPKEKREKFSLRFFPEGGQLVQGIPSVVAFKAECEEAEEVECTGTIVRQQDTLRFQTMHDGMGCFLYTPTQETATARITWKGKEYAFELPKALPEGYVVYVQRREETYEVRVMKRLPAEKEEPVAVFFSHQGRPVTYRTVQWRQPDIERFTLPADLFPEGVLQVSVLDRQGKTLCERFCYVRNGKEKPLPKLKAESDRPLYAPFAPVSCRISLKDAEGKPVKGSVSVAVRNRNKSDYREYDDNICTDLLLTSDLKGYIHRPAYYFADYTPRRQRELDVLMLVHGWRKYDTDSRIGNKRFTPRYLPEKSLTLDGQVLSPVLKKGQPGMNVSLLSRTGDYFASATTQTDTAGYFHIPTLPFEGEMQTAVQVRRPDKERNRLSLIRLLRDFRPPARPFAHEELHPEWLDPGRLAQLEAENDSIYRDSLFGPENHWLEGVTIRARSVQRKRNTLRFEHYIYAFYDVEELLDETRDEGKEYTDFNEFIRDVNPFIYAKAQGNIQYYVNGQNDDPVGLHSMKYAVFCRGQNATFFKRDSYWNMEYASLLDNYPTDDRLWKMPAEGSKRIGNYTYEYVCYIVTKDNWNPHLRYDYTRGMRYTTLRGYSRPLEFYSPCYLPHRPLPSRDPRRTLYWNPNVETDDNGEAVIQCYNTDRSGFLLISAETICDGQPVSLDTHSANR